MKIFKTILVVIFLIFMVSMLWIYWFTGFGDVQLSKSALQDSNFSINLTSDNMQFYENLRYSDSKISYHISDKCTLQKKADAERAFEILENKTILDFYPVNSNEEILITCESKEKIKEDYFVAGEGGPVNISRAGQFNVIYTGQILLIRQSECPNPNIALHEILHALGFGHSSNKNNIMYEISECSQTLGDDIPRFIDELYSIPSKPDLAFEEVVPLIHDGKYLDLNMSIKNIGLKNSGKAFVNIYLDNELFEEIELKELEVGSGMKITIQNLKFKKTNFKEMKFIIVANFEELNKANNEASFDIEEK
ncbi:MAG TPA: M12 family metallopeptidase [Candidatus Nanoarchaeia archaeon]|nr:M12 family metallopeptidase [Candidatus Nanoarchaeia archaeon]